eukprot:comp9322_c0_seq1/m.4402 comp9322_c0_seq1/g.4402  ORF comp9322_c0_seq1/g.4402 comp9322_c0_seq1/m.4402 type:complete len:328 (-) comp9322_c0_seq1:429-1412(-)
MSQSFSVCARRLAGSLTCRRPAQLPLFARTATVSPLFPLIVVGRSLQTRAVRWNKKDDDSPPIDTFILDPNSPRSRPIEDGNTGRNHSSSDDRKPKSWNNKEHYREKWANFAKGMEEQVRCFRISNVPILATPDDIEDLLAPCHIVEAHQVNKNGGHYYRQPPFRTWYVMVDKCNEKETEKTLMAKDGSLVGGCAVRIYSAYRDEMVDRCNLHEKEQAGGWTVRIKNVPLSPSSGGDEVRNLFTRMGLDVMDVKLFSDVGPSRYRYRDSAQRAESDTNSPTKSIAYVTFGKATHAYRAILEHNHTMVADLFKNAQTSKDHLSMKILY